MEMTIARLVILFFVIVGFAISIEKSFSFLGTMLGVFAVFWVLSHITKLLVNLSQSQQ